MGLFVYSCITRHLYEINNNQELIQKEGERGASIGRQGTTGMAVSVTAGTQRETGKTRGQSLSPSLRYSLGWADSPNNARWNNRGIIALTTETIRDRPPCGCGLGPTISAAIKTLYSVK